MPPKTPNRTAESTHLARDPAEPSAEVRAERPSSAVRRAMVREILGCYGYREPSSGGIDVVASERVAAIEPPRRLEAPEVEPRDLVELNASLDRRR